MALLHNRISQKELKERLYQETEPRITISFYQYFPIEDPVKVRDELYKALNALTVFGRIYVAHEGINAQLSVPQSKFEAMKDYLYSIGPLHGVRLNRAIDDDGKSFWVLKIKVRDKIVADGISDAAFSMTHKGKYVNAEEMNELMKDPETVVIDMRNHYEYEVGHFENAVEIPSDTFKQQLPMAVDMMQDKKDKTIVMYCTGGIRCEKASAYMLHNGFKNVFHLEGGIINYAREAKERGLKSKFIGKNFVFDERLGERITEDIIARCHQCDKPADSHTNCANSGCHLLFIQCDECAKKYKGCCSKECLEVIHLPEEEQKKVRAGIDKGRNIFNKSKARLRPRLNPGKGLLPLVVLFVQAIAGCKGQTETEVRPISKKWGLEIDSTIRQKVKRPDKGGFFDSLTAYLDVTIYENDEKKDIIFLSGKYIPHWAFYSSNKDTTAFLFNNFMPTSFGLSIILVRDSCYVTHFETVRGARDNYRYHPDSPYVSSANIRGRAHVILDRYPLPGSQPPVYGFVEFVSDDFYHKSVNGDSKKRVEYKGYFKASTNKLFR